MNTFMNTFFAKPSGSRESSSKSGKSPYGNRRAAGSDTDLSRYARDYQDSYEQAKERMRGSQRTPKAPEPPKASNMYYVDATRTQTSSRSTTSRSTTPQPFVQPSATTVPFPATSSRTYQQPPPPQTIPTPRRRTQSMSLNQAPDPNTFTQHLRKTARHGKGGDVSKPPRTIYFYEKGKDYYNFTNFSPHPVLYDKKKYPTSEHLFQAMKFLPHRPNLAEHIRTAGDRPTIPFMEARRFEPEVRPDWRSVNLEVMDMVLEYKFTQHPKLMEELLATGEAKLVEDAKEKDAFWGNGADGKGLNHLGYALMKLRDKYKKR